MEHPLSDMMTNTMSKIKDMIDVNTVVGSPITLSLIHISEPTRPY